MVTNVKEVWINLKAYILTSENRYLNEHGQNKFISNLLILDNYILHTMGDNWTFPSLINEGLTKEYFITRLNYISSIIRKKIELNHDLIVEFKHYHLGPGSKFNDNVDYFIEWLVVNYVDTDVIIKWEDSMQTNQYINKLYSFLTFQDQNKVNKKIIALSKTMALNCLIRNVQSYISNMSVENITDALLSEGQMDKFEDIHWNPFYKRGMQIYDAIYLSENW